MRTYVTELELDRDKYELNVFDMCEVFALEVQTDPDSHTSTDAEDGPTGEFPVRHPHRPGINRFKLDLAGLQARWCSAASSSAAIWRDKSSGTNSRDDYHDDDGFLDDADDDTIDAACTTVNTKIKGFFVNKGELQLDSGEAGRGDDSGDEISSRRPHARRQSGNAKRKVLAVKSRCSDPKEAGGRHQPVKRMKKGVTKGSPSISRPID